MGYGGWLVGLGLFFFLFSFFSSPICGFEWSVACQSGGGLVFSKTGICLDVKL